jgi:sulfate transport system ATP-binding protein
MSVAVRKLHKRYFGATQPVLSDCTFSAPTGAITSLLGPSGSGKTTLLRTIAGLETPDSGVVLIGDKDCTGLAVQKRGVGFVFQSYALFANLTVRDNIGFALALQRQPAGLIAERVESLLGLIQLGSLGDRYPRQLSGGQQQRVALARALAARPQLLLLDEPFGALDVKVRLELRQWLLRLHEQTPVTTLLVTHDQEEALELSQHIVVMSEGRVEQSAPPSELYDRPASPFVAQFVGGATAVPGHIAQGRAHLGPLSVAAPADLAEGSSVVGYIRPDDLGIAARSPADRSAAAAVVRHPVRLGAFIKLDLEMGSGLSLPAQLSRSDFTNLNLHPGATVTVELRDAKLFPAPPPDRIVAP